MANDGSILLIHPLTPSARGGESNGDHVVHKRETWDLQSSPIQMHESKENLTCLFGRFFACGFCT